MVFRAHGGRLSPAAAVAVTATASLQFGTDPRDRWTRPPHLRLSLPLPYTAARAPQVFAPRHSSVLNDMEV
ncbi:hypothetical protein E2C01_043648 [Portunus trituberculatus]|uniref:Uncharacterized protein n=1 Tax=Portunus trituberculatus TaxID=210409 RepID=A0A5B7FXW2_PORTR|nr:hypothetical protein [Portunus trituberculatus]